MEKKNGKKEEKIRCFHLEKTNVRRVKMVGMKLRIIKNILGIYVQMETFLFWQVSELWATALQK